VIKCAGCGREFRTEEPGERVASISGSIMGDEYIDTWYRCPACDRYTVDDYHDAFLGESTVRVRGPVSRADGDPLVALIRRCDRPWDKKCRCPAHREYFNEALD
jgi:hypothetical protein